MAANSKLTRSRWVTYNPAFLSEDVLVETFVVRGVDHSLVLETIRDNDVAPNEHVLLVGPRGSGKTTLLRRATISVKRDPVLGERWFPIILAEESYQVTNAGELWLEALFHLAEQTQDPGLQRSHAELHRENDDDRLRERALAVLLDFADAVGKRLLLVVENLQMLCAQVGDDDAWKIRHTLQSEPRVMILASAVTRFDTIESVGKAFYELFKVHELPPLDENDCNAVWSAVSGEQPALGRTRPLQILTGGNLRLMTIISRFAAEHSLEGLLGDLMQLVDEHTEYFKSHLDGLPATERKVYLALAEIWAPATAREVADLARIDVHRTSALLGRLGGRGAVTVVESRDKKKRYQLTERLYNIYYLMRRRGSPSQRVKAAVNFMVGYYSPPTLVDIATGIARDASQANVQFREEHLAAYDQILEHPDLAAVRETIRRATPESLLERRRFTLPTAAQDTSMVGYGVRRNVGSGYIHAQMGLTSYLMGNYELAKDSFQKAVELGVKFGWVWAHLGNLFHRHLNRYDDAVEAYRMAVEVRPTIAWAWIGLLELADEGQLEFGDVLRSINAVIERVAHVPEFLNNLAWTLFRTGRAELLVQAEEWSLASIKAAPDSPISAFIHASILCALGRVDDAIIVARPHFARVDSWQGSTEGAVTFLMELAARGESEQALELLRVGPSEMVLECVHVALERDGGIRRPVPREIDAVAEDILRDIHARRSAIGQTRY